MQKRLLVALLLASFTPAVPAVVAQTSTVQNFDGKSWWDYVKILASDDMEGRETGSAGLRKASAYVVQQLEKAGLQAAGSNGFYQPVQFVSRQIDESGSSIALVSGGKFEPLVLGEDAMFSTRANLAPSVNAPLVFVGYGLKIPEKNYNDFAGLDVKGKVVVFLSGSPADMPTALASHYQSLGERARLLRELGALGYISIPNPASMDIPWGRMTLARARPSMTLADPSLDDTRNIRLAVTFNPADAEKLFAGSGHTFAEIAAIGKDRGSLPHFSLAVDLQAKAKVITKNVESSNIVAKLPGTDAK